MSVNINNYPTLKNYAILSGAGISAPVAPGGTTVANGYYGSTPTPSYTGNFIPVWSPSGANSVDAAAAETDLGTLIGDIVTVVTGLPSATLSTNYINTNLTLLPNICYTTGSSLTFTNTSITLDATNVSNAQFFISVPVSISFTTVPSITLINGTNCNVFWIAGSGAITFDDSPPPSIPGIFIAATSITFAGPSQILGRLYTITGSVTFAASSSVNATCTFIPGPSPTPIGNVCFLENTKISTDQGKVLIQDIDPSVHTINDEKIVAVTKTITQDDKLICFMKNSLGPNHPNEKTVMSKNHKILYQGKLVEAHHFVKGFKNVNTIKYNGEILYNILMENYRVVKANNLVCESLHPKNLIAKLYTNNIENINEIINDLNSCILKKDHTKYLEVEKKIYSSPKK